MTPPRPVLIELDDAPAVTPSDAPAILDAGLPAGRAMEAAAAVAGARPSRRTAFALWALGALLSFMLSVAVYDFVSALLARNTVLGGVAFALAGVAIVALAVLAGGEAAGYLRLSRLDTLREAVQTLTHRGDIKDARRLSGQIAALYANRPDLRWAAARLRDDQRDIMDADALLRLTETHLMGPLDQTARREVEAAARRVATATALLPLALADVAVALYSNLRMIRQIAQIYGGRSGVFGSFKLLRRVFGHLLATGALALGDDLIGSVAGGGIVGKLSRRFGEGLVNGALTARVGIAAMELCRPMPFDALPRPKVGNVIGRALTGVFADAKADVPEPRD